MIKKLILFATTLLVSLLIIFSCNKESQIEKQAETDKNSFSVAEAKSWYVSYSVQQRNSAVALRDKKISNFYPQWNKAITTNDKNYEIVECPLKFDKNPGITISTNRDTNNIIHGITRLLILKNKKGGVIRSALMHIYSTTGEDDSTITYSKRGNHFSGYIFFTDVGGEFVNGWQYDNGKIIKRGRKAVSSGSSVMKALPPDDGGGTTCYTVVTDWYERDCVEYYNGDYQCGPWQYVYSTNQEYCQIEGGGADDGSGGIVVSGIEADQEILVDTSITNHEKVNCVYQNLMSTSLQSGLKHILSSFDNNEVYNVTFKIEDIDVPGRTSYLGNNDFLIKVDATDAYDDEYSRIWLASTFIHEAFHAQLRQKALELLGPQEIQDWPKNIDDMTLSELETYFQQSAVSQNVWNDIGHDWMLKHIDEMTNAIKEFVQTYYPITYSSVGASSNAYKALALMGLSESTFYSEVAATIGDAATITNLRSLLAGIGTENCSN